MSLSEGSANNDSQLNPIDYYSLESFLFSSVNVRFHQSGSLGAFDFFSIVIWKANRAKSKIAKRLIQKHPNANGDLDLICRSVTESLSAAKSNECRLRILIEEHGFLLPMASAILTVLWPEEFGVYDIRVCDELNSHHRLKNRTHFGRIWSGYQEYLADVRAAAPANVGLRDADRFLWGRSAAHQLQADIARGFGQADTE